MIGYASNTGTRRNLAAIKAAGWRLLLTPENPTRRFGIRFGIDNGAWGCFQRGIPFQEEPFQKLLAAHGVDADFVVVPDIVADGEKSLQFSLEWLPKLARCYRLLLPVQDGMIAEEIRKVLIDWPLLGIFLGGSTDWKLATMREWGILAAEMGRRYHVGRVNTARRIRLAEEAGATSFDGTSATRYSCSLPLLESARQQPNLFNPRRCVEARA